LNKIGGWRLGDRREKERNRQQETVLVRFGRQRGRKTSRKMGEYCEGLLSVGVQEKYELRDLFTGGHTLPLFRGKWGWGADSLVT